jgi:hypothetical protein
MNLNSFKLGESPTRKVTSYLDRFYFVAIIGFAAIGIPIYTSSTHSLNPNYAAVPIVSAGVVVITFLVILAICLILELAVAVAVADIHIKVNTERYA